MTANQHARLREVLFPGDGCESGALALCGTCVGDRKAVLCVHRIQPVPIGDCQERSPTRLRWDLGSQIPLFEEAGRRGLAILKLHSHPTGFPHFSATDNSSDREFLEAMERLVPNGSLHCSAVMMPDGRLFVRRNLSGKFQEFDNVMVVGDEVIRYPRAASETASRPRDEAFVRTRQAFGPGTVERLHGMRIGVVGASGTGSWVVEMLARLGTGELLVVDPDKIERKNLNRIVNSRGRHARTRMPKVDALASAVRGMGLGTKIDILALDVLREEVIKALAQCDFLFGCMDSADGRDALNRIAAFYCIPYVDVGVLLEADGCGGIKQICAAVHYLIPDGSSLLSRGVITPEQVRADSLHRRNPVQYAALRKEGYIANVRVDSPAVVSINGFGASHGVNEMLARIHPFRRDGNDEFRYQVFSLSDGAWLRIDDGGPCPYLGKRTGRGDVIPLIENSEVG